MPHVENEVKRLAPGDRVGADDADALRCRMHLRSVARAGSLVGRILHIIASIPLEFLPDDDSPNLGSHVVDSSRTRPDSLVFLPNRHQQL